MTSSTIDILARLTAFPTVSRDPNIDLIRYVAELLGSAGIWHEIIRDETGAKANLFATVGPRDRPGVMLSGHTDVVPVEGQNWTKQPFELTERDGRLYGRGTADMKGFVASALSTALAASTLDLATPLHLALSYDEELGCLGVHSLIEMLEKTSVQPVFCIVGEPTNLSVATGHKGKTGLRATFTGKEAHSALAPTGLNAIHLAVDFIQAVRAAQAELAEKGARDGDYDVPYTTLHVGGIQGGVALNIVPNHCEILFEIRNLSADDPQAILQDLREAAGKITAEARHLAPEADIVIETFNAYPGLNTPPDADVVEFVKSLTGANGTIKVAFGTEGGLFDERLGVPVVVCGPGSMEQGHKPDEFVSLEQLQRCDLMLAKLVERLEIGL
jgi:acetylornithine deacetylase